MEPWKLKTIHTLVVFGLIYLYLWLYLTRRRWLTKILFLPYVLLPLWLLHEPFHQWPWIPSIRSFSDPNNHSNTHFQTNDFFLQSDRSHYKPTFNTDYVLKCATILDIRKKRKTTRNVTRPFPLASLAKSSQLSCFVTGTIYGAGTADSSVGIVNRILTHSIGEGPRWHSG